MIQKIVLAMTLGLGAISAFGASAASLTQEVKNDEAEVLVADGFSRTLYVFDMDQGKAQPVCNGTCAEIWPPYVLDASEVTDLKAPLGSIVRANKQIQLTYNGRPLYLYAFDRKMGDDHGDGVGGVWHYIKLN